MLSRSLDWASRKAWEERERMAKGQPAADKDAVDADYVVRAAKASDIAAVADLDSRNTGLSKPGRTCSSATACGPTAFS